MFCDLDKNWQIWKKGVSKNHWDAALGLFFVEHLGVFESPTTQSLVLEKNQPANVEKRCVKNHWDAVLGLGNLRLNL